MIAWTKRPGCLCPVMAYAWKGTTEVFVFSCSYSRLLRCGYFCWHWCQEIRKEVGHSERNLCKSMCFRWEIAHVFERAWIWGLQGVPKHWPFVLFQTLCILANIADGTTAKELIMTNDDILQKIKYYMVGLCPLSLLSTSCTLEAGTVALLAQHKLYRCKKE